MATENKSMKWVVLGFITLSLLVFGSILVEHQTIDIIYLVVLLFYFLRYLLLKAKKAGS